MLRQQGAKLAQARTIAFAVRRWH